MPLDIMPPDEGRLSVDQAASLLGQPQPAPEHDKDKKEPVSTVEPSTDESGEPVKAISEDEGEGDKPETDAEAEPVIPAIEPPHSWDAEAKAKFSELPPDIQDFISKREKDRESAISKALQEAAEKRKSAEDAANKFGQFAQVLDNVVPQALQTFQDRWSKVDWAQLVDSVGAEEALKLRMQHETEQRQLTELQHIQRAMGEVQYAEFVKREAEALPKIAPELADPKEGPKRKGELQSWLIENGIPREHLSGITAVQASIAYKAMLYDKGMKGLSQPKPKPAAQAAQVKPSAAPSRSSKQQNVEQLRSRLSKTGRIDDAVALLNARGT